MYLLCLFPDFHIFNDHYVITVAQQVLLFSYFGCPTTVCTVYLLLYNYIFVKFFELSTIVEMKCCCCYNNINNNNN